VGSEFEAGVLHWFGCTGQGAEEFHGTRNGDRLQVSSKSLMGFARLTYEMSKPGSMCSWLEVSRDQQTWSKLFDGTYARSD
jgi:hypothetical protein